MIVDRYPGDRAAAAARGYLALGALRGAPRRWAKC